MCVGQLFAAKGLCFVKGGGGAQLGEVENCDEGQLNLCVELIPRTPVGLPRTKEELDAHCL